MWPYKTKSVKNVKPLKFGVNVRNDPVKVD